MLFDCGKVEFRLQLNPEYKANRPPMPDDLRSQIPLIKRIASAFGWELMQHEGLEADDLIGGMALKYSNIPVGIVSSDKDLSQLIDDRITMLIPVAGGFEVRDAAAVKAKFGVPPENIIDYLALIGDNSDNIPGVPGIGPKSAADIIHSFGAAEKWIDSPQKLDPQNKFVKKLLPHLDVLRRNRELIRLRTELPQCFAGDVPPVRKEPDWSEIRKICEENQFRSILKELPDMPQKQDVFSAETTDGEDDLFTFAAKQNQLETSVKPFENEKKEFQDELF